MKVLAEATLDFFITFIFAGDEIDGDFSERIWQSFPEYARKMEAAERDALSVAARERIAYLTQGPDAYGYDPGSGQTEGLIDFLELVASGEIFTQWSG